MDNSPRILSLCTGYGGLELGLTRVFGEIRVLAHVEIECFAIANLVAKMETGQMVPAPIWTDLKTFRPGIFRGMVDILTGGYPCQPFSAAGKRRGDKDPRHLWPYVRETIRACQPRWVFLENVEGHLSKGIVQVLSELEEMAYRPVAGVFSAAEVGAPHQRKRAFILAHRESDGRREGWPRSAWEQRGLDVTERSGTELADTRQQGPQRRRELEKPEERRGPAERIRHDFTRCYPQLWPAPENPNTHGKRPEQWPTPRTPTGGPEKRKAKAARGSGGECLQTATNGKLNPDWVEQLMGLEVGWTDLGSWGTE